MQFQYKNSANLSPEIIEKTVSELKEYSKHLRDVVSDGGYQAAESSINLPSDEVLLTQTQQLSAKKKTDNLKYIFVIGIGGSNLGTKAVYDAIHGYYDVLQPERFPKIIFLDTQDEAVLHHASSLINTLDDKGEFIINAISKSGGTTETMANLEVLYSALSVKFGDVTDCVVFTTDANSKFHKKGEDMGIDVLTIPDQVGGRFSIFSAVGLFPLLLAGINIMALRDGAVKMREICVNYDLEANPAILSSTILYLHSKQNKYINDNFIFLPQLESLGKWYRQLMGESIGKEGKGITPTVSIGSTDLHSVGQLYLGGPKDKITTFVYGISPQSPLSPISPGFNLIPAIDGKNIHSIMNAIVEGTKIAYKKQDLPFMTVEFDSVNEEELGAFLQFKMIEMMYLGKLLEVNTFDQPHVELYKSETKHILESG